MVTTTKRRKNAIDCARFPSERYVFLSPQTVFARYYENMVALDFIFPPYGLYCKDCNFYSKQTE